MKYKPLTATVDAYQLTKDYATDPQRNDQRGHRARHRFTCPGRKRPGPGHHAAA